MAAITLAITVGGYAWLSSSQAFRTAVAFAEQSNAVRLRVGDVRDVRLDPFGSRARMSDVEGEARLVTTVEGARHKAVLVVRLEKGGDRWCVRGAALDGLELGVPPFCSDRK